MTLILDLEPPRCTAQHKGERIVRGRYVQHYEKQPQKRARLAYLSAIREALSDAKVDYSLSDGSDPLPLAVRIEFVFSATRKKDIGKPKVTRPDLDNMAKGLLDCLTQAGLLIDDAQITELQIAKRFEAVPCVCVAIENDEREGTANDK